MLVRIIRSLVYAGLISCCLGMTACAFTSDWDNMVGECLGLAVWTFDYLYYRYILKWW